MVRKRLAVALTAAAALAAAGKAQHPQWPTFQRSAAHSGQAARTGPGRADCLRWEVDLGRPVAGAAPVVDDGLVLVADRRDSGATTWSLDALRWTDGSVRWSIDPLGPVAATPAIAGERLYVGTTRGHLGAFELADRRMVIARQLAYVPIRGVTVADGRILLAHGDTLRALDATDGSDLWSFRTGDWYGTPSTGQIYRDPNSGGDVWSVPAVTDGYAVIGCLDGKVYAISDHRPANFTYSWSQRVGGGAIRGSVSICGDAVFVGCDSGRLCALDLAGSQDGLDNDGNGVPDDEGEVIWSLEAGSAIRCTPTFSGNRLVFTTTGDTVHCVDLAASAASGHGVSLWSRVVTGASFGANSPIIAGDRVYALSEAGDLEVHCLRLSDGARVFDRASGSTAGYASAPAAYGAHVFAVTAAGVVQALHEPDSIRWEDAAPPQSPPARAGHAMVYERARAVPVTLLFGGAGVDPVTQQPLLFGDTWQFDGSAWTPHAVVGPSARRDHALAHDWATPTAPTVLFGGDDGTALCGDTWEWTGAAWLQRATTGPTPRRGSAMAFDELATPGRRVLLFGGEDASGPCGDTWTWDTGTGQWTFRLGGSPARWGHAMATDAGGYVVMFGGHDGTSYLADTWQWRGTHWQRLATGGPPARVGHAFAYDVNARMLVMFGGHDDTQRFGDCWVFDGTQWTEREVFGPGRRHGTAMVRDVQRSRIVLFGGETYPDRFDDETWEYRGDVDAGYGELGIGCGGVLGVPRLAPQAGSRPIIGTTFTAELTSVPPLGAFGLLAFGRSSLGGLPLPLELTMLRMPGCWLYVEPLLDFPIDTAGGIGVWAITLPADIRLLGARFQQQCAVLDPSANPAQLTTTNALEGTIGSQ
ncbi:MAG: PQQ-binding-like beta-propeller repeat protein [Planctomycetes bacterium]|nr:PQQ-binding-like beta-propeller repeat protein [Planctomycetota bacterium]